MTNEHQAAFIPSRLKRLEYQLRMMKFAILIVLVMLSLFVLLGMKPAEEQQLSAKEFILLDDSGKTRARLFFDTSEKGPQLIFYNSNLKPALQLALKEVPTHGSKNEFKQDISLTFLDKETNPRVALGYSEFGRNFLNFNSKNRQNELVLSSGVNFSTITMGGYYTQNKAIPILLKTTPMQAEIAVYEAVPKELRRKSRKLMQPRIRLSYPSSEDIKTGPPQIAIYGKPTTAEDFEGPMPEIFCAGGLCGRQ